MAWLTLLFSLLLIALGVGGYSYGASRGSASVTALIPAFFGAAFALLAVFAIFKSKLRKHLMHGAVLLSVLGIAGTASGVLKLLQWVGGESPVRPAAVVVQSMMFGLLVLYVVLAVRSFLNARRARQLEAKPSVG